MLDPVFAAALAALVDFLESHPGVGLVGSRLEGRDGTPQISAFRFPTALGELDAGLRFGPVSKLLAHRVIGPPIPREAVPIDWVSGASLMVRRAVFDAIGLLDDGYFMYYEEVDFCLRAREAGWPCWSFSNHDVVRAVTRWAPDGRPDPAFSRLLVAFLLSLRGSVSLYQGEELGLPEAYLTEGDLRDPFGIAFWPEFRGRDGSRTPMP